MRLLQDYEFDFVGGGCGSNPTCYCVGQDFAVDIGTNPCAVDGATNAVIERTSSSSSSSGGIVATIGGVIKRIFGGKVSAGVETETTTTTTTTIEVDCSTTDSGSGSGGDGDGDGDDD